MVCPPPFLFAFSLSCSYSFCFCQWGLLHHPDLSPSFIICMHIVMVLGWGCWLIVLLQSHFRCFWWDINLSGSARNQWCISLAWQTALAAGNDLLSELWWEMGPARDIQQRQTLLAFQWAAVTPLQDLRSKWLMIGNPHSCSPMQAGKKPLVEGIPDTVASANTDFEMSFAELGRKSICKCLGGHEGKCPTPTLVNEGLQDRHLFMPRCLYLTFCFAGGRIKINNSGVQGSSPRWFTRNQGCFVKQHVIKQSISLKANYTTENSRKTTTTTQPWEH